MPSIAEIIAQDLYQYQPRNYGVPGLTFAQLPDRGGSTLDDIDVGVALAIEAMALGATNDESDNIGSNNAARVAEVYGPQHADPYEGVSDYGGWGKGLAGAAFGSVVGGLAGMAGTGLDMHNYNERMNQLGNPATFSLENYLEAMGRSLFGGFIGGKVLGLRTKEEIGNVLDAKFYEGYMDNRPDLRQDDYQDFADYQAGIARSIMYDRPELGLIDEDDLAQGQAARDNAAAADARAAAEQSMADSWAAEREASAREGGWGGGEGGWGGREAGRDQDDREGPGSGY